MLGDGLSSASGCARAPQDIASAVVYLGSTLEATHWHREGGWQFLQTFIFSPDWQIIISINDSFLSFQNLLPSLPVVIDINDFSGA